MEYLDNSVNNRQVKAPRVKYPKCLYNSTAIQGVLLPGMGWDLLEPDLASAQDLRVSTRTMKKTETTAQMRTHCTMGTVWGR